MAKTVLAGRNSPASDGAEQKQGLGGLLPQRGIVATKSLECATIQISEPQEAVRQLARRQCRAVVAEAIGLGERYDLRRDRGPGRVRH